MRVKWHASKTTHWCYIMKINCIIGDVSIHNGRIWSNGTGSRREAFTVTHRFRNPLSFYQV